MEHAVQERGGGGGGGGVNDSRISKVQRIADKLRILARILDSLCQEVRMVARFPTGEVTSSIVAKFGSL